MVAGADGGAADGTVVPGADDVEAGGVVVAGAHDEAGDPCRAVLIAASTSYSADPLPGSRCWTPSSPIVESSSLPPAANVLEVEETIREAAARFETQVSVMNPTRIHRFPHHLRGMGGPDDRYVVPSVVAIGPYHHKLPHLLEMEELKKVAAHKFCRDSGSSVMEVYERIFSVTTDHVRGYYTAIDGSSLVAELSDPELAHMMFLDGCFLLQYMENCFEPPIVGLFMSCGPSIDKDIFLLENQIPWLVLDVLIQCRPTTTMRSWRIFLDAAVKRFLKGDDPKAKKNTVEESSVVVSAACRPLHLLGLLRSTLIQNMPPEKRKNILQCSKTPVMSSSAVELAQIGIKVSGSKVSRWFADIDVQKKTFLGELSLSPLFLNDINACILVNMAALEAAEANAVSSSMLDGHIVSSYLSVLAMLMDRDEDVHVLRTRGVLCSPFSNTQTLAFFKGLSQHLRLGYNYSFVVEEIEGFKRNRPVRIAVHKFVYDNFKLIAAVLSIAGVLIGIFKAIYSVKKT